MPFIEQLLEGLKAAEGDTRAQAAVAAEFVLRSRPVPERQPLREALDAAAVLRWFDAPLLANVLDISETDAAHRFEALKSLPFVEPYRRGERDLRNLHEATRLGWRRRLYETDRARFQLLSRSAADCFASETGAGPRIEWIFHRLGADPDGAADSLETLDRQWTASAHPEDRDALASALKELEETRLLAGAARVEVLLCVAEARSSRGETSQLEQPAREALAAARSVHRLSAIARAHGLLGDVLEAQGKLEEAQAAFGEALRISRRLAELDPANANWQWDLAVTCRKLARMEVRPQRVAAAVPLFEEAKRILDRLVELAPQRADWTEARASVVGELAGLRPTN